MKRSAICRFIFATILTMALALPPASAARAATLVVTSNADSGAGSLRQAIATAAVGDTITFASDMTITLSSQLVVDKGITITGAGHHITISGNHVTRVFLIPYAGYPSGYPTFDHLTIADGNHNIDDCFGSAVSCGNGMALDYLTGATITNSAFTGNSGGFMGGAIYAYYGTVTITNTTFANNSTVAYGGAVDCFYCTMTLTNNTFYGNILTNSGGYGSTLLNTWGTVTFRNNLLIKGPSSVNMCDGEFSDGGATIDGGGNLRWGDSSCPGTTANPLVGLLGDTGGEVATLPLLPGSAAIGAAAANCPASDARGVARIAPCDAGAFESTGFSLVKTGGDNQSTPIRAPFANPLAVSVVPDHAGDPVDGGTVTFTAPSSGASITTTTVPITISAGAAAHSVTANAVIGGPYQVTASATGAINVAFSLTNTCLNAVTVVNNADGGVGTLRQAVADVCVGGQIIFDPSLAGQTITLTSGPLAIGKSLTIIGPAASPGVTISGNQTTRVFNISAGTVNLTNLTIRDGAGPGGAGMYITNSVTAVTINNSTLTANTATGGGNGGAVMIVGPAALILNNSTVSGNSAGGEGGGIYNQGILTANNSTIAGNSSTGQAGGVFLDDGVISSLRNTILVGNSGANGAAADCAMTHYAAIYSGGYNMTGATTNCTLANSTTDTGGWSIATLHLGPLQNNGGPTATHALLTDSPAIGFIPGCNSAPGADQRGISRPQGTGCDAGAFELVDNDAPDTAIYIHPDNPSSVTNALFTFSGNDGSGSGVRGFECQLDGGEFSSCASGAIYRDLATGNHAFEVRAIDRLGNVDATPASFTWKITHPLYLPLVAR